MCRAEATLVYGLTVRSASLVFAADAWTRLQHSFRFFDLVFLRRRKGGLVSSTDMGDGPVTRLPNEVWEEIRHWLVKEELAGAQDSLLGPLFCVDPTCQLRPPHWERVTWLNYTAMNFDHCYGCEGGADEFYRDAIQNWDEPHRSSFGEDDSGETCTTAECGGDTNPDEHTIVDVSFQNLPSDIDQRFERFIKLFDLQVVESSVNKLSPKSSKSRNKEEEENKATTEAKPKNGVRDEVSKKIKPVWKLYSTCVTTW